MFNLLLSITRNTFLEAIRQPIFVVLILVGALFMVICPFLAAYSMDPGSGDNRMLVDLQMGNLFFIGMFLAAFTATGVVAAEMESRTALTIVSKPVPRPLFILGKFLGVSGALLVAHYILLITLLFTIRHKVLQNADDGLDGPVLLFGVGGLALAFVCAAAANYLYNRVFASVFTGLLAGVLTVSLLMVSLIGPEWSFQPPLHDWQDHAGQMFQIVLGAWLMFQGVLIVTAAAVACSTRLSQVMTLMICLIILPIGLTSGTIAQLVDATLGIPGNASAWQSFQAIAASDHTFVQKAVFAVGKILYLLSPNLQFHWPSDAITQGHSLVHDPDGAFSISYLARVSAYTAAYLTALLAAAVALFQKREVS